MLKNNPMVKKLVETGEERVGKLAQALLSNERFVTAIQTLIQRTLSAKGMLDKSLRSALAAMNLPSTEDVESLRRKIADLDATLSRIESKLEKAPEQSR